MLTNKEWLKWYKGLLIGGGILFASVIFFWTLGEFEDKFALLIGMASAAFIWQGYRGVKTFKSEVD